MSIARLLHATARSFADQPALSYGERRIHSYGSLQMQAVRMAAGLRALPGLQPGDRIGLAMKNCPQYIELMWASWHAGLCVVPMNAKLHAREIAFILENCGVQYCFSDTEIAHALAPLAGEIPGLRRIIDVDSADYAALAQYDAMAMQAVPGPQQAWLFYTSGTTGKPKGATLTHGSLLAMVLRYYADVDHLTQADSMIHAAPLSHATGLYAIPHIAKGSHHVIPDSQGFDVGEMFDLIRLYPSCTFFTAPTMLTRMVNDAASAQAKVENIRTIFYGGAPMYLEDLKRALNTFGPCMWQGYGQGETPNTISCLSKAMHADSSHPRYEQRLASVGIPRTGVEVRVVDGEGRDLPPGEIGEVICRSDVTMSGYWNNPAANANSLRDGWLYTGDLATFDEEGFLTLKDRSKDMIISGGSNIYPREVEEVLLLHPDVLEVSVVGRPHADWGEEVVAFVVPRPGRQLSDQALEQVCLDNIARFKRPKQYVHVEALPKNNYGKVLKTELRETLKAKGGAV